MAAPASGEATRRERIAQGFPPHVTDPAVLERVAALLLERAGRDEAPPKRGPSTSSPATLPGTTPASPRGEDLDTQG